MASSLLLGAACTERGVIDGSGGAGPGDGDPPELVSLRFLDAGAIELTFSEDMHPPDGVDPEKFKLSMSWAFDNSYYGGGYGYTSYSDPFLKGEEVCEEYCWGYDYYTGEEYCYEYCKYDRIPIDIVDVRGSEPDRIVVHLDPPIDSTVCDRIDEVLGSPQYDEGGLFVHYSNNGSPTLMDTSGTPLDAIGEAWVLQGDSPYGYGNSYVAGEYPTIDPHRPIPCPPGL